MRWTCTRAMLVILTFIAASPWREASAQEGSCTVAANQQTRRNVARQSFATGQERFEANDFQAALSSFECSFRNVPHPSTLYNIARAAELAGEFNRALDAWRGYLQMNPEAEDRAQIEERIRGLEQANSSANVPGNPGMTPSVEYTPPATPPAPVPPTEWTTPENVPTDVYNPNYGAYDPNAGAYNPNAGAYNPNAGAYDPNAGVYNPNMATGQEYQTVEMRPPSPWRRNAWYLFGGGALVTVLGLFLATPLLNVATDDDATPENDGACYDAAAEEAGDYEISSACWISGAVLAGVGGAVMLTAILLYALSERGGPHVVNRTAAIQPTLSVGQDGDVHGLGGTFSFSF